jgi:hypothetical protein
MICYCCSLSSSVTASRSDEKMAPCAKSLTGPGRVMAHFLHRGAGIPARLRSEASVAQLAKPRGLRGDDPEMVQPL